MLKGILRLLLLLCWIDLPLKERFNGNDLNGAQRATA
jgi:hypothetical protein